MLKVAEFAYARVQVPDLDRAETFFNDFGLVTAARTQDRLYLRGTGPDRYLVIAHRGERRLLALAFSAAHGDDLQKAALIPDASAIRETGDMGGGRMVTLADPDGNSIEIVHGVARAEPIPLETQHFNSASGRDRRRNAIVRPARGPSHVMRIGHAVIRTPNVRRLSTWYQNVLGLLPSDDVPLPDGSDLLMSFLRLDHGEAYVDHHAFQVLKGEPNQLHHLSFEVQDIDDLNMGHHALREAGYTHMWGMGRHHQGSQIFDYWLDPFGTMYEHWTDTDMLNASMPKVTYSIDEIDSPWGPRMPQDFLHHGTR